MSKYLVTVSYIDSGIVPLRRVETMTVEIADISKLEPQEIINKIADQNWGSPMGREADGDVAIDFMMKMGD